VEKLVKERASVGLETGLSLLEGNKTAEDRKAAAAEIKAKMADLDGQIKDLLGKEDYEKLTLYEDSTLERLQLQAFDALLTSKDMKLDEPTEAKLMDMMYKEREKFPFVSSYMSQRNSDVSRFTPQNNSRFRSEYAQLNDKIAEQAAGIFTVEQLGLLRQSQEQQMTVVNMQLGVAVRMFSGAGN
jgi:dynactin complex subunit